MALAAPLLIGLALLATYIGYLILQRTMDAWLRPVLQWLFAPRQAFWKRVLLWPVAEIGKGLRAVMRYVAAILGGAFYLAGAALARFLHALGWTEDLLTLGLVRAYQAVVSGLVYLREVAIPRLVEVVVKPVRADALLAKALATAAATTLTGISTEFASGLRSLPWGSPQGIVPRVAAFWNAFEHLWDQVFKHIVPRVDLIQYTTLPRVAGRLDNVWDDLYRSGRDSITGMRTRLRTLERSLGDIDTAEWWRTGILAGIAALAGVTVAAVTVGIRALFCRNTRGVAQKLCGLDEALVASLLAGTLAFGLLLDPKLVARTGQAVEGTLEGAYRTMAGL